MANVSLDKDTFFRRMKRLYAAWKVSPHQGRIEREISRRLLSRVFSLRAFNISRLLILYSRRRTEKSAPTTASVRWTASSPQSAPTRISFTASPRHCRCVLWICITEKFLCIHYSEQILLKMSGSTNAVLSLLINTRLFYCLNEVYLF